MHPSILFFSLSSLSLQLLSHILLNFNQDSLFSKKKKKSPLESLLVAFFLSSSFPTLTRVLNPPVPSSAYPAGLTCLGIYTSDAILCLAFSSRTTLSGIPPVTGSQIRRSFEQPLPDIFPRPLVPLPYVAGRIVDQISPLSIFPILSIEYTWSRVTAVDSFVSFSRRDYELQSRVNESFFGNYRKIAVT